ncbi:MAG: HYR domain-containing protein [Bacteroidota bacterium]
MVSKITSLNRNACTRSGQQLSSWCIWCFALVFSVCTASLNQLSAQCGLNDFTMGNLEVTLTLDANGQAILEQDSLIGIVNPTGTGCSLYFYDFPAAATPLGSSVTISCDGSTPFGPGQYFVVADDDATPGGNESAPMVLNVITVDDLAPMISGSVCGASVYANTSDDGMDDCETFVSFDAPSIDENCYSSTTLTITYSSLTANTPVPVNEAISNAALQDSLAAWASGSFTRLFSGSTTVDTGKTQVIFTISDGTNPPASCTVIVGVSDDEIPYTACPPDITVSTGAVNCMATNIANIDMSFRDINTITSLSPLLIGEYTDNCGVPASGVEYMVSGNTTIDWTTGSNVGTEMFNLGLNTVTYRVTDYNGNSRTCSFDITVVDNTPPSLTCPGDISANTDAGNCSAVVNWTPPSPTDNCDLSGSSVLLYSSHDPGDTFPLGTTTVTYRAVDNAGNESTCSFDITVTDNEMPAISCPVNQSLGTDCGDNLLPDYTAQGMVTDNCMNFTVTQMPSPGSSLSSLTGDAAYTDNGGAGVDAGDVIAITLMVSDNAGGLSATCTFDVTLAGYTNPVPDQGGISLPTLSADCGSINVPAPTATDFNCPPNTLLGVPAISTGSAMLTPLDGPPATMYQYTPSGTGTAIITWTYTDGNNVTSTQNQSVEGFDDNPPTIDSYLTALTVNLDANGQASVSAADLFIIASDDCATPTIAITPTSFDCDDLGPNLITISVDDGINPLVFASSTVTVADQISPVMVGVPASVTVDCDNIPGLPTIGVDIVASDNCGGTGITFAQTSTQSGNPDFCTNYDYEITRSWTATDASGNQTTFAQKITVEDVDAPQFSAVSTINVGTDGNNCSAMISYMITSDSLVDNCAPFANLDVSYVIDYFSNNTTDVTGNDGDISGTFPEGTHRVTYTAVDPCGNTETHVIIITVTDDTAPIASCLGGAPTVSLPPSDTLIIPATFIDNGSFDNCTSLNPNVHMELSRDTFTCVDAGLAHFITLTVTDNAGNSSSCNAQINIQDNIAPTAICQNLTVTLDENGLGAIAASDLDNGSFDNCTGTVPGTGVLTFTASQLIFGPNDVLNGPVAVDLFVRDLLGNRDTCTSSINVTVPQTCFDVIEDNVTPPGFVSGTAGTVVQVPLVVSNFINAQSFQFLAVIETDSVAEFTGVSNNMLPGSGFTSNMISSDTMSISWFNNASMNNPATFPDGTTIFTFDVLLTGDVTESTDIKIIGDVAVPLEVIRSYSGTSLNTAPCTFEGTVLIDNPAQLTIAGNIFTENNATVGSADVDLFNQTVGALMNTFTTGASGNYSFFPVSAGRDYLLSPRKDINWTNGVSALDLSLIQRHIVGIDSLDSPYKKIAADAFPDNSITTFDVVQLFTLLSTSIPGPPTTPTGNTSWRFVPLDFVFPNAIRRVVPAFPETIALPALSRDTLQNDFIAVKIGDVEGNADPLNLTSNSISSDRSNSTLAIQLEDRAVSAGELVELEVSADNFQDILAYQWTLEFDTEVLEYVGADHGELNNFSDQNIGLLALDQGILTMIWYDALANSLKTDELLFTLRFRAKSDLAKLSHVFQLANTALENAAFNLNQEAINIELQFNTESTVLNPDFSLMQNTPNPFKEETIIGFNLPEATFATMTIMDISGRVIKQYEGNFVTGYNEIRIHRSELANTGVLYYQLDTPEHTAVKKMIIIE